MTSKTVFLATFAMVIFLLFSFFITSEYVIAIQHSCGETEWNNLSQKYNLEEQFFKIQEVIDTSPFNQTLYNNLKGQYDQSVSLAERECDAIGADKADQLKIEQMKLDSYSSEIHSLEERKRQLEDEERKLLWMEYERALENRDSATQNICPPNSTFNGIGCNCNNGYIANGNYCILNIASPTSTPTLKPKNSEVVKIAQPTINDYTDDPHPTQEMQYVSTNEKVEKEQRPTLFARVFNIVTSFISKLFRKQ